MNRSQRPRRLRQSQLIRDLVAETDLTSSRMIQPHFVCDGANIKEEIAGLPGIYRESVDEALKSVTADRGLGVNKIMLFGVTDHKSEDASYSHSPDNPVMRACRELKERFGKDLFVSADVCLCAYTKSGHCGLVRDGEVDNDSSVEILVEMALALAATGCDCVAPSDMMDGRIGGIRSALEREGLARTIIMAYTAKYSSAYYGPFREAAKSAPASETAGVPDDRKTYQMDSRNQTEALRELELDIAEGADIVMVKPALAYLDVIAKFKERSTAPVAAYNVSGEYAAVKLMAREGLADERELALENLTAIRRAGASVILTYHLRDILKHEWLER
ncbi:MAG: porphobilinogen synthase [Candidatus Zixiibacteriota bacterium]